jgi:RNA polymerase sigma-70 factor (ECF subfamily)
MKNIASLSLNIKGKKILMPAKLSQISDGEIMDLVCAGNERAYGELFKRYLDEIYRYLYYRVARNQQEAEDLTQEVFIKAWDVIIKTKKRKKKSNFRALLYRIAHNLSVDRWRTSKDEQSLQEEDLGVDAADFTTPEKRVLVQERSQALAAAVRELDPQLQNVFICRFINELSHAETAQCLGIKEGHVRVLQHRALKKIRIILE